MLAQESKRACVARDTGAMGLTKGEKGAACIFDKLQGDGWEAVNKREKAVGISGRFG